MYLVLQITADFDDGAINKYTQFFDSKEEAEKYYRSELIANYNGNFSTEEQSKKKHKNLVAKMSNIDMLKEINDLFDYNYGYDIFLIECLVDPIN